MNLLSNPTKKHIQTVCYKLLTPSYWSRGGFDTNDANKLNHIILCLPGSERCDDIKLYALVWKLLINKDPSSLVVIISPDFSPFDSEHKATPTSCKNYLMKQDGSKRRPKRKNLMGLDQTPYYDRSFAPPLLLVLVSPITGLSRG